MPNPAVAVFTREPVPGQTKTRLAATVGATGAAGLARAMLCDAAAAIGGNRAWHTVVFVEPPAAAARVRALIEIADVRGQASGSIGDRMAAAAGELFAEGYTPVVLVGSDIPALGPDHIDAALRALESADLAIGPAADGGYYLLACRRPAPALFADERIPWSTAQVLEHTVAVAAESGLRVQLLATEHDLDTADDLAALRRRLARQRRAAGPCLRAQLAAL